MLKLAIYNIYNLHIQSITVRAHIRSKALLSYILPCHIIFLSVGIYFVISDVCYSATYKCTLQ